MVVYVRVLMSRACMLSCFRVQLFVTPRTVARHTALSMAFSRKEYWSELTCLPPGVFPTHDQTQVSLSPALQADSFPLSHQGSLLSGVPEFKFWLPYLLLILPQFLYQ